MSAIATEIALILLLIIANGIFSGSEIAVLSARKIRLENLIDQGNSRARAALKLANSPNDFLSTVQIGITLVGILSGAVGGATVAQRLKTLLDGHPTLQPYSEQISVVLVVTIITYLSLVIGELVPKRIALNNPEGIACTVAKPMQMISRLTAPLVHLLGLSTDTLIQMLGIRISNEPSLTEEEIKVLIRQGAESGMFEETEHKMLERVFRLGDRPIKALMTPRIEIVWLDVESPLEETLQEVTNSSHSRFPVARGSLDHCIGIVRGSRLLSACLSSPEVDLEALLHPPLYVAESTRALNVLEEFKQTGMHMALVTNEYGGIEGAVTLNDLMEAIVGDLPSLEDWDDPLVVQREDGSWLIAGSLDVHDFKDVIGRDAIPDEDSGSFYTLGGFILHFFGKIPRSGEGFEWSGLHFEVMDMDGTRVDKVLITPLPPAVTDIPPSRR